MAAARMRSLAVELGLTVGLLALSASEARAQLGARFDLWDRQAAVARVRSGDIVRMRLVDGRRAGGPLLRWDAVSARLGPYMGYAEQDTVVALSSIDSLWRRGYTTRRGVITGGVIGTVFGLVAGSLTASLCPTPGGNKPCAQGAISSAAAGLIAGGLAGGILGSGEPRWQPLLPRGARPTPTPPDQVQITLTITAKGETPDPRALALMRAQPNTRARLGFGSRPDIEGYVVQSGVDGATLWVPVGPSSAEPVSLDSVEAIWERGTARRAGSIAGLLLGAGAGSYVQIDQCQENCTVAILAGGAVGAFVGWMLGDQIGKRFPRWQRRF